MIHPAQQKQQLGLLVEPCPDPVHHGGNVLAHGGPVGAAPGFSKE